MTNIIMKMTF